MELNNIRLENGVQKDVRQVEDSLNQGAQAGLALAAALEKARQAAKALASTSSRVKRVLAGFDQITRLGEEKKSSSSSRKKSTAKEETPQLEETVNQVSQQLQSLDVPATTAIFNKLLGINDIIEMVKELKRQLSTLWHELLDPLMAYCNANFDQYTQTTLEFGLRLQQGWNDLQAGAAQFFGNIGAGYDRLTQRFRELVVAFLLGNDQLGGSTQEIGQQVGGVVGAVLGVLTQLKNGWNTALNGLKTGASAFAGGVVSAFQTVTNFLQGGFTKNWKESFFHLKNPVEGAINSIIGFLNKMLSSLGSALNGVINAANKLKFTVPDWVPGIGGKSYGFSFKNVTVPQIPYLAKGAVLPANQPFMAVVGDQKHGTNVEAPLATIQEAVAAVWLSITAGNMAGHEATVAVLRQILEAVLGIDVGEAVMAKAAQSYQRKYAVMRGGGF